MTVESPESRLCPIHPEPVQLPLSEFGIARSRPNGRNLYCKSCVREKVKANRRALKEYRASRKRFFGPPIIEVNSETAKQMRLLSKVSPVERVREAIRKGARTQKEIARETRIGKDEIGDALAELLLWTREIKTQLVDGTRHYFINEGSELPIRAEVESVPRQGDVRASFSTIAGLMPGKKRSVG